MGIRGREWIRWGSGRALVGAGRRMGHWLGGEIVRAGCSITGIKTPVPPFSNHPAVKAFARVARWGAAGYNRALWLHLLFRPIG
jgi:hypothetical protein